ncbi:UNVERIFIED_CONTAM: hypothetical protein FKN15_059002 [Acipenser sinensis]
MSAHLTAEEEQATKQFLEEISKWTTQHRVSPLSWNVAVKFLMARKFDVLRAIELFHCYRETRLKEGIVKLKPQEEPLRSELLSGKFTVLSVRDPSGASIALFTAKLHHPHKMGHHVVLQALFYLLDRAVESFETQRNGLVFIYDMAGSNYTHFELDLSKKILSLLKGAFPARLKKVFIVGAPVWFRVPYNLLSLLLKEKLRERVQMVKMADLRQHMPRDCLPEHLGGVLALDPLGWNRQLLAGQNGHADPLDELVAVPTGPSREEPSIHTPGLESMTLQELVEHLRLVPRTGIYEEYDEIRHEAPPGTFNCALAVCNQDKNRYGDVLCLDQTRVRLKTGRNETCEQRQVTHCQYLSWPDYGVPSSAGTLLDFLGVVKRQQKQAVKALGPPWKGHPAGPPIVVHCSAGIGRTGTLCALDICLSQLQDVGTLNIYQTVRRMRTQRAFSIQTSDQYYFCYTSILEHAQRQGTLTANQ